MYQIGKDGDMWESKDSFIGIIIVALFTVGSIAIGSTIYITGVIA